MWSRGFEFSEQDKEEPIKKKKERFHNGFNDPRNDACKGSIKVVMSVFAIFVHFANVHIFSYLFLYTVERQHFVTTYVSI